MERYPVVKTLFTDTEWDAMAEFLRIAQTQCLTLASSVEQSMPRSPMAEKMRMYAEQAADYRERIEGR